MGLQDQSNVIKRKEIIMNKLEINETKSIIGGGTSNFTGPVVNAFRGIFSTFFEIGQAVGGAIRRITTNNLCKF